MKLKIGSPATGTNFYPRPKLRAQLLRALDRDHVAFLGPRRTGKTSLIRDIERHPPEGAVALYLDLQGLTSVPAWLRLMLAETRKALQTPSDQWAWARRTGKGLASALTKLEEIEVLGAKIKVSSGQPAYDHWRPLADDFLALLQANSIPLIFMLDEFPWFLGHVAKHHTTAEVEAILNWFRQARQTLGDSPTRFLVTGSIGLAGLLRRLDLSPAANDFDTVEIPPLSDTEALDYLEQVALGENVPLSAAARRRILARLGVGWPILLATFVSEIQDEAPAKSPVVRDIDRLYEERLVRGSRNKYCDDLFTRLTKPDVFNGTERRLAQEILRDLSRRSQGLSQTDLLAIHARLVPDEAQRALLAAELDYVLETLRHDGYLRRVRDPDPALDGLQDFASHILRDYWRHRTA